MMRPCIWFHGVCSDTMGIYIERRPPRIIPQRRYTRYKIPGRSGEVLKPEPGWENYVQPYEIAIVPLLSQCNLEQQVDKVSEWLIGTEDYQRLEDSYNPGVFRLAAVTNAEEVVYQLGKFGRATLHFECLPERRLVEGDLWEAVELSESGIALSNPTPYTAKPLISVTASGTVAIAVNHWVNNRIVHHTTYVLNIGNSRQTILIDSEKHGDATYANGKNANGILTVDSTGDDYARLYTTGVSVAAPFFGSEAYPGTVTAMRIKSRWFIV